MRRFGRVSGGCAFLSNHPASRDAAQDKKIIWQQGTTKLLDYAPDSDGKIILVIPCL